MSMSAGVEVPRRQLGEQVRWVLDPVDAYLLLGVLVPTARIDENVLLPCANQQTVQGEPNPVLLVTRGGSIPENLGDDTEHRSPVQTKVPV